MLETETQWPIFKVATHPFKLRPRPETTLETETQWPIFKVATHPFKLRPRPAKVCSSGSQSRARSFMTPSEEPGACSRHLKRSHESSEKATAFGNRASPTIDPERNNCQTGKS